MPMSLHHLFPAGGVDPSKWTPISKLQTATIDTDGNLILGLTVGSHDNARIQSILAIDTNSTTTISVDYQPGRHNATGYGLPYIALVPASISRDSYYQFPFIVPMLILGQYSDTTSRTRLYVGIHKSPGMAITGQTAIVAIAPGIMASIEWIIDWQTKTMSVSLDGQAIVQPFAFSYTVSQPLYIEIANCGYANSLSTADRWDNFLVGQPVVWAVGGTVQDAGGAFVPRIIRAYNRGTGDLIGSTTSDPATGTWQIATGEVQTDVLLQAGGSDACDLWLPNRTPIEVP